VLNLVNRGKNNSIKEYEKKVDKNCFDFRIMRIETGASHY